MSTTREPGVQRQAEHDVEPEDVEQRQHAEAHVVGASARAPACACTCSRFASRLPCVSIAAFGEPAVPLVNISTARSSSSRSTIGTDGSAASRSSSEHAVRARRRRSVTMTNSSAGRLRAVELRQRSTARPGRRRRPGRRPRPARARARAPGCVGLSGTATRPAPSTGEVGRRRSTSCCRTGSRPGRRARGRGRRGPPGGRRPGRAAPRRWWSGRG